MVCLFVGCRFFVNVVHVDVFVCCVVYCVVLYGLCSVCVCFVCACGCDYVFVCVVCDLLCGVV